MSKLKETWDRTINFIREYTGKEPGTNGERNTTQYDCDKGSTHAFLEEYEKLFTKFKEKQINILEIGISGGWSLHLWKEYFQKGSKIIGIDLDPLNLIWKDENKEVQMIFCDSNDSNTINSSLGDIKLDIIIDDGSHQVQDMLNSFDMLFNRLNQNGLYVMEDVDGTYPEGITYLMNKLSEYNPKLIDLRHLKNRYDDILIIIEKK
jgi:hypothetical protein